MKLMPLAIIAGIFVAQLVMVRGAVRLREWEWVRHWLVTLHIWAAVFFIEVLK